MRNTRAVFSLFWDTQGGSLICENCSLTKSGPVCRSSVIEHTDDLHYKKTSFTQHKLLRVEMRKVLEPHLIALTTIFSTTAAYLIILRFCIVNDLPFFEVSNYIGTSKLVIFLIFAVIFLFIVGLFIFPCAQDKKDLLSRYISRNSRKQNTNRFFVLYGYGISLSISIFISTLSFNFIVPFIALP